MHQGAWLVWATGAGLAAVTTTNPFYLAVLAATAWVVHAARGSSGPATRSFRIFAIAGLVAVVTRTALVFVAPVFTPGTGITQGAVAAGLLEGLRLATLLVIFGTFNSVTDPYRMLGLAPRRFHEPALAAALALSIAPRTIAAAARVREAQRLRGMDVGRWRALPALAVPVLENGMEEAVVLAESMDARGHGRGARSRYRSESWRAASVVIAAAAVSGGVTYAGFALSGAGALSVSTTPLVWPEVSGLLIAAAMLFALPAFVAPEERSP